MYTDFNYFSRPSHQQAVLQHFSYLWNSEGNFSYLIQQISTCSLLLHQEDGGMYSLIQKYGLWNSNIGITWKFTRIEDFVVPWICRIKICYLREKKKRSPDDFSACDSLRNASVRDWRRKWQPTPVFLPGESQGQQSLVGCRLWGRTELDTIEVT